MLFAVAPRSWWCRRDQALLTSTLRLQGPVPHGLSTGSADRFEPMRWCFAARRLRTQLEATLLVAALRCFRSVTLLICGELGVDATALRALWAVAQEVVVSSEQERDLVIRVLGVPSSLVVVRPVGGRERGEILVAPARGDEPCGARSVTVAGPHEWVRGERTRNLANLAEQAASRAEHDAARAARLVLGDHASTLGRPLRRALQPLRRRVERRARGEPR